MMKTKSIDWPASYIILPLPNEVRRAFPLLLLRPSKVDSWFLILLLSNKLVRHSVDFVKQTNSKCGGSFISLVEQLMVTVNSLPHGKFLKLQCHLAAP